MFFWNIPGKIVNNFLKLYSNLHQLTRIVPQYMYYTLKIVFV